MSNLLKFFTEKWNQYFHESILVVDDQTFNLRKSVPSKKAFQVGCIPPTFLIWERGVPLKGGPLKADPPGGGLP